MNRKYNTLAILGLAVVAALSLANSGGSPGGRTGSDVDEMKTCGTLGGCHNNNSDILNQNMISTNIPETGYEPGEQYQVTLSPAFDGAGRYGFEMMAQDATPAAVGTWASNADGNAQAGGERISHKFASIGGGDTKTWVLDWTAPESGTGDLTLFASVLAANGNGNTSGDRLITDELEIIENKTASLETMLASEITLYPNPVVNSLHLKGVQGSNAKLQVLDISGKLVLDTDYTTTVDVSTLPSGTYQLKIVMGDIVINKKFVKH